MSKFIKTALSNFSNLFQTDNDFNINTSTYINSSLTQENNSNTNVNDTVDLDSYLDDIANQSPSNDTAKNGNSNSNNIDDNSSDFGLVTDFFENLADVSESVGATKVVVATSMLSGVAKVGEYIGDGLTWVGGKLVEGGSWLVGEFAGLFSKDTKEAVMDWREDFKADIKSSIEVDQVGELNKWFYENTKIGQSINDASYLKYDSEAAQTLQNVTVKLTELAAATGVTIATGGVAAPAAFAAVFGLGFAEGVGKNAETTYQNGGDFDDGTLSILLSGGLNGLSWYANGKLGQGAYEIFNTAKIVGLKSTATDLLSQVGNKEFIIDTLKNGLNPLKTNLTGKTVLNVNALMNYGSSAMAVAGDFAEVLNSEEGFTAENIAKLTAEYFGYLGLNILEDTGRDFISGYTISEQQAKKFAQQIASDNSKVTLNDLNKFTDASKTKVLNSMDTYDLAVRIQDLSADDIRKLSSNSTFNKKLYEVYKNHYSQNISIYQYYNQLGFNIDYATNKLNLSQLMGDSKLYLNVIYKDLEKTNPLAYNEVTQKMQQEFGTNYRRSGDIDTEKFYEMLSQYMGPTEKYMYSNLNSGIATSFESALTKTQKDALFNYTACGGFEINTYLVDASINGVRTRDKYSSIEEIQNATSGFSRGSLRNHDYSTTEGNILEDLDSAIASAKYDNPIVTYRGVGNLYNNGEIIDVNSLKIGSTLESKGYLSSSLLLDNAYLGNKGINGKKNICLEILVPPNSGTAAYIENVSGASNFCQTEMLLKRNQTLTVLGKPYYRKINGEQITFVPVGIE